MSLKQAKKLFKAFSESIRTFKDIYYFVEPISDKAKESVYYWEVVTDEDGVPIRNVRGNMVRRRYMKFRFSWSYEHFRRNSDDYVTDPAEMSEEDKKSFKILEKFVDDFAPAQCVTRAGEIVFEEDGTPALAPRYINTAQLLACSSHREAMELLGTHFIFMLVVISAR